MTEKRCPRCGSHEPAWPYPRPLTAAEQKAMDPCPHPWHSPSPEEREQERACTCYVEHGDDATTAASRCPRHGVPLPPQLQRKPATPPQDDAPKTSERVEPETCPFCDYKGPSEILYRGRTEFIIEPLDPVCEGHLLVIPHQHVEDFAENGTVTGNAARTAAWWVRNHAPDWFDAGSETPPYDWNLIASKGALATQTVPHLHFHLIPRREGDGLALPWSPASALAQERKRREEAEGVLRVIADGTSHIDRTSEGRVFDPAHMAAHYFGKEARQ